MPIEPQFEGGPQARRPLGRPFPARGWIWLPDEGRLNRVQRGDAIRAVAWNKIVDQLNRMTQVSLMSHQLPHQATPDAAVGNVLVVRVATDGGLQGSADEQCSFTYAIYEDSDGWSGTPALATGLTPLMPARTAVGRYIAAPDGSKGMAQFQDDVWTLLATQEVQRVVTCA